MAGRVRDNVLPRGNPRHPPCHLSGNESLTRLESEHPAPIPTAIADELRVDTSAIVVSPFACALRCTRWISMAEAATTAGSAIGARRTQLNRGDRSAMTSRDPMAVRSRHLREPPAMPVGPPR